MHILWRGHCPFSSPTGHDSANLFVRKYLLQHGYGWSILDFPLAYSWLVLPSLPELLAGTSQELELYPEGNRNLGRLFPWLERLVGVTVSDLGNCGLERNLLATAKAGHARLSASALSRSLPNHHSHPHMDDTGTLC